MFCAARSATCASYSARKVEADLADRAMEARDAAGRRDPARGGAGAREASGARRASGAAIAPVVLAVEAKPLEPAVDEVAGAARSRRRRSARPFTVRIIATLRGKGGDSGRGADGQHGRKTRGGRDDRG